MEITLMNGSLLSLRDTFRKDSIESFLKVEWLVTNRKGQRKNLDWEV